MADVWANSVAYHPRATFQGAATWQIQWHVIPEPCITFQGAATWWFHSHDSIATLQGAVTWRNQCHDRATLHGCKNSICHIESSVSPYTILFFFGFLQRSLGFAEQQLSCSVMLKCVLTREHTSYPVFQLLTQIFNMPPVHFIAEIVRSKIYF